MTKKKTAEPKQTKQKQAEAEYTAEKILKLVEDKRNSQAFKELAEQMDEDFDLFALKDYEGEPDHQAYTSPKPRNDFKKVSAGVNKGSLTYRIGVPEDAAENERQAANKGELFFTGVLDITDRQQRAIAEPPLRQALSWFSMARGATAVKCLIYVDDNKETQCDIRPLDPHPQHFTFERGANGLVWAAYEYHIGKAEAQERYGVEIESPNDDARVVDFFTRKVNAVVLSYGSKADAGGEFVKKPTAHGLDHVPIFIGFAGDMPTVFTGNNQPTLRHRAASVYDSSRSVYEPFNKQVSFLMDVAEKSVAGTLVYQTVDGKKQIKGDPFRAWTVIQLAANETLAPLQPPQAPPEVAAVLGIIDRDKQESTLPFPIAYGRDEQGHSGSALSIMQEQTESVYSPYTSLLANAYHWLWEESIKQFKAKGTSINIKGMDTKDKFFATEITPADIQDDWYLIVKCEPRLPRDEASELQMALAATQARPPFGRPLISDYTAREKIMKLQDPDAEEKRIETQQIERTIEQLPNIQVRRVAEELLAQGDAVGAQEILASVPAPGAQGQPQGVPQGGPQPASGPQGAQGQVMGPNGQPLSPQDIQQAVQLGQQLAAQGQPLPPELQAVLAQIPAPKGAR